MAGIHGNKIVEIVLSSDESDNVDKENCRVKRKKSYHIIDNGKVVFIPDDDYDDEVTFVEPENYSPQKKQRLEEERRTAEINTSQQTDSDLAVTFDRKGVQFPHPREHCKMHTFTRYPTHCMAVQTVQSANNEKYCEKCYCFVCDDLSSKCELWKTGTKPHCNAYGKNSHWEKERRLHKRLSNMKEMSHEPILSCLSPPTVDKDLTLAAASALFFHLSILELSDSLHGSDCSCICPCHYDVQVTAFSGIRCRLCYWIHTTDNYTNGQRCEQQIRDLSTKALNMAMTYLTGNKPSAAIVVLDTISTAMFGMDIPDSSQLCRSSTAGKAFDIIVPCWIEAAMHAKVDKSLLAKAIERIHKASEHGCKLFQYQAKSLNRLLKDLKSFGDPLVIKCLKGQNSNCELFEQLEIAKVRLEILKKSKRFTEAINYCLGVGSTCVPSTGSTRVLPFTKKTRLCDQTVPMRKELIELLVQVGRFNEAANVSLYQFFTPLPKYLMDKPPITGKKSHGNAYFGCTISSLNLSTFKKLINGLMDEKPSQVTNSSAKTSTLNAEERMLKAIGITLPALYVNSALSTKEAFEFYFDKCCSGPYKNFVYPYLHVSQMVHKNISTLISTKLMHGKPLDTKDLKPPEDCQITTEIYVIEILSILAAMRTSLKVAMSCLVRKELYWACISLLVSPDLQDKILAPELQLFVDVILPHTGCCTIPLAVMYKWYNRINPMTNFEILYKLACGILDMGQKMKGQKAIETKKKAILLSQKLTESIMINSHGQKQQVMENHLRKLATRFSTDANKLGIRDTSLKPLEIKFLSNPSFKALEAIKKTYKQKEENKYLKKREILLQFLQKNFSHFEEASIDIYSNLEMYEELKICLAVSKNYETICGKIHILLIKAYLSTSHDVKHKLVDATKDCISRALVWGSFYDSFRIRAKPIGQSIKDAAKLCHDIDSGVFKVIMNTALDQVVQLYLDNTVQQHKRIELEEWLIQIRSIYTSVDDMNEWSVRFQAVLNELKRKSSIIMHLQRTVPPN